MQKPNIAPVVSHVSNGTRKALYVGKVALAMFVIVTSVVGSYVLFHAELRNRTIDFAQNQSQVEASPKAR